MLHAWKNPLKRKYFLLDCKTPVLFISCQWQYHPKPHLLYLIYRCLITVFFVVSWIMSLIDVAHWNQSAANHAKWLIYLTNWGFTLCIVQSCLSTVMVSISYFTDNNCDSGLTAEVYNKALKPYKLYWVTNIIATDIAFGITILYWTFIYNEKEMPIDAMNIIVHGLNSFVMFLDLWIVAHPVRMMHFYFPVLFGMFYVIFSIIYYYAGGTSKKGDVYIYTILNWTNPGKTIVVCLGVTVFIIVLHTFTYGIYRLRKTSYERLRARKKEEESKMQCSYEESFGNPVRCSDLV